MIRATSYTGRDYAFDDHSGSELPRRVYALTLTGETEDDFRQLATMLRYFEGPNHLGLLKLAAAEGGEKDVYEMLAGREMLGAGGAPMIEGGE